MGARGMPDWIYARDRVLLRSKGSHRQFAHPVKNGVVTVSYHSTNEDIHPKTAASIFRQAGLDEKEYR